MRNINRIDPIMKELGYLWKECVPDWRFMQLISNFQSWIQSDGFYIEDDKLIEKFRQYLIRDTERK